MYRLIKMLAFVLFVIQAQNTQAQQCQATYSYSANNLTANFTGSSSGGVAANTWSWSFGDGTGSVQQNPTHTYNAPGTYYVCLTASKPFTGCYHTFCDSVVVAGSTLCPDSSVIDSNYFCPAVYSPVCGCDSVTYSNSCEAYYYNGITSYTPGACGTGSSGCTAIFTYNDSSSTVFFQNQSTGNYTNLYWDFGDGNTSTQNNPVYTYNQNGYYNVCLSIYDSAQTCFNTSCQNIQIGTVSNCMASFGYSPDSSGSNTINFYDYSTGGITGWYWNFGDGNTDSVQNPVHTFSNSGIYYVCLYVFNSTMNCSDSVCYQIYVGSQSSNCMASFGYSPDSTSANILHFYDYSFGNITSWQWNFGDGNSSFVQNPTHTYNSSGYYNVCLIISDSAQPCSDTICYQVMVGNSWPSCIASYTYSPDTSGSNSMAFFDTSLGDIYFWSWSFGDGNTSNLQNPVHNYSAPGMYKVCLVVSDSTQSCTDSTCQNIYVTQGSTCVANFTYGPVFGNAISFSDSSTGTPSKYSWSFGDGTTSSQKNPFHNFPNPGVYNVCLTISDSASACFDVICKSVTVGNPANICYASFTYNQYVNKITFNNTSTGNITGYLWDFGDGTAADTSKNPVHSYSAPGVYQVCLTVTNFSTGCFNTYCDSVTIAASTGNCVAKFTFNVNGNTVMFNSNSSAGLPVSWHWDFGDFSTSSVKNPTHFYLFPFTYNVCLTITTALGCYDTFCDSVTIQNTIGIAESMQLADLKIYPNPFSNEIIIESEILNNNLTTITLTNLMGQQVLRYSTEHSNLVKLNLSEINSGVYIMHITNGEKYFVTRISKTN